MCPRLWALVCLVCVGSWRGVASGGSGRSDKQALREVRAPRRPLVGMCLTGMPSRMIPESLLEQVVAANAARDFFLVFVLERSTELFFQKGVAAGDGRRVAFGASAFHNDTAQVMEHKLKDLAPRNARLHVTHLVPARSAEEWRTALGLPPSRDLDIMRLHRRIGARVFNMYLKQRLCAMELLRHSELKARPYEMIINTREDAVVMGAGPVDLGPFAERLRNGTECGMISKACNSWDGVSMRFQIYEPRAGLLTLSRRLDHIQAFFDADRQVMNAESFEAHQLGTLGIPWCPVDVTDLPITAGRLWRDGSMCIPEKELRGDCVPRDRDEWLATRRCEDPSHANAD